MSVRRVAGNFARSLGPYAWARKSYSQEGEDLVVDRLFGSTKLGVYVDVGSHHPFRFSNTYLLYRRGWRGLCVDPLPGSAQLFNKWRPKDIAVEMGVSAAPSSLVYYMFNEPALNSFDETLSKERDGVSGYNIIETREIRTDSLTSIISAHLNPGATEIDLLSIDVEGFDLEVLQSNDWTRIRPSVVIVECLGSDLESLHSDPTAKFLMDMGYRIYAKTGQSVIFTGFL